MASKKLIIWGYPLYSDTFSYVWYGFYKAAQASLSFDEVHWFSDGNCPNQNEFDYSNSIFLCEGYQDGKMPLRKDGIYFVHCPKDIGKYLNNVGRFIDLRYHCDYQDHPTNYKYVLDKYKTTNMGPLAEYEKGPDYERLYLAWATDLLPEQFNFNVPVKRSKDVYFIGTRYGDKYSNSPELDTLRDKCKEYGLNFVHIDPWLKPVSIEDNYNLIRNSHIAPDIRGKQNVECGYIPCRIFKNISYGHLGLTNSRAVHSALAEQTIYHPDVNKLFDLGMAEVNNIDRIKSMMRYVQLNHTYINRLNSLRLCL